MDNKTKIQRIIAEFEAENRRMNLVHGWVTIITMIIFAGIMACLIFGVI